MATEHMSRRRDWFKNYIALDEHEHEHRPVRIGSGDLIYAVGIGDIDVLVYDGKVWNELVGVSFVSDLVTNLSSQGKCHDKGCDSYANSDEIKFTRNGEVVAIGVRNTGLYQMMIKVPQTEQVEMCANVATMQSIRSWHDKMAHQNIAHVKRFLNRNGIP